MSYAKKLVAGAAAMGVLAAAGVVGAAINNITTSGSGFRAGELSCPGGMTRLGHAFDENTSVFEYDPAIHISDEYTVNESGYKVEDIDTGGHAGTHIDVPAHFIDGARTVDQFTAEEFVWPVYKIDVRGMTFEDDLIQRSDIADYQKVHGNIQPGSLVVLQTGAEEFFGLDGEGDQYIADEDDNAANIDDLFDFANPGFSGDAVQYMFDDRFIAGVGSDAYGPDAASDDTYDATYTTLLNDGIALVALANLDSVSIRKDIIIASPVNLTGGSGFSVDPIACHGQTPNR